MYERVLVSLKQIPCFSEIPAQVLKTLAEQAKPVNVDKCMVIIKEGEATHSLYVVLSGKVKASSSIVTDKPVDLVILEPGDYFGEMAFLTGETRAATVTASENTKCAVIERSAYQAWLKANGTLNVDLVKIIADKVSYMHEKAHQLTLSCVYEKLIKVLKEKAEIKNGALIIPLQPSVHELAALVGADAKQVKEIMKALSKNKYVVSKGQALHIALDLPEGW